MTPRERLAAVVARGVRVHHDGRYEGEPGKGRRRVELPDIVTGVFLPLTPGEWCAVAMREGDQYAGGCCGNTSAMNRHDEMEEELEETYRRPRGIKADIVPCTVTVAEGLRLRR